MAIKEKTVRQSVTLPAKVAAQVRAIAKRRRARVEVLRTRDDEWSAAERRGIESGAPEYNAVDASLWFVVTASELLERTKF